MKLQCSTILYGCLLVVIDLMELHISAGNCFYLSLLLRLSNLEILIFVSPDEALYEINSAVTVKSSSRSCGEYQFSFKYSGIDACNDYNFVFHDCHAM